MKTSHLRTLCCLQAACLFFCFSVIAAGPAQGSAQLSSGSRLGFNIIIYDGDKMDAEPGENINESRQAWAPRSGVQGRPEDWGRLDLE